MQIPYSELVKKLKGIIHPTLVRLCKKTSQRIETIWVAISPSLRRVQSKVSQPKAIASLIALNLLFAVALFVQAAHPVLSGSLSAFAQGEIGIPTLRLGDISIHPFSAIITNKAPVCLVFMGVEIERRFWDGELYLMNGLHTYPAASVLPIGQDALFGQKQIRAIAFHPDDLCQRGSFKIEDLSLLLVHPNGIGIISFVGTEK